MRLLLHTALLATIAIAVPAPRPDCGRGEYNTWGGDASTCAEVDHKEAHTERDGGVSRKSSLADTNGGRGAYNGWDGDSKESSYADFGRQWHRGRDSQRGSCDLRNAVMPAGKLLIQHTIHLI